MSAPHSQLDALSRDLDALAAAETAAVRPEVTDAREAIRQAAEAISHDSRAGLAGPYSERALALARLALDRARQAVGPVGGQPPAWQEALQAPLPAAPDERRRSAPPAGYPDVQVDSEIPETHPAKAAIEASVAGAFAGVKGRWRVAILVQPNASWWGVRVESDSVCWTGTLEGPEEQSPDFLGGRVREAVRLGLMRAALRRPRQRA